MCFVSNILLILGYFLPISMMEASLVPVLCRLAAEHPSLDVPGTGSAMLVLDLFIGKSAAPAL
jgi:hypothetical protein